MNRKMFSLVTSFAILSSSLSPTWAAGKNFTYYNLEKSVALHAEARELKRSEAKEELPLVTETMPDESVKKKYARIIFVPETSKVNGVQNYGKLLDKDGNEVILSNITYKDINKKEVLVKGKEYYVLKNEAWMNILKYEENNKQVFYVRKADNDESDPEKKNEHKFFGWKLDNNLTKIFDYTYDPKLKDKSIDNPLIFKSVFQNKTYFYDNYINPERDSDGYKFIKKDDYHVVEFNAAGVKEVWQGSLSLKDSQKQFYSNEIQNSKKFFLFIRKDSGTYKFGDYKPEPIDGESTFWYWYEEFSPDKVVKEDKNINKLYSSYNAQYINKYLRINDELDLREAPLPSGFHQIRFIAEDGYRITSFDNLDKRFVIRDGCNPNIILYDMKIPFNNNLELVLRDKNDVKYSNDDVAWYDGYKKIDDISKVKIDSDKVFTARVVRDFESEKFNPKVKELEAKKNEDLTLEKLKEGITNLPEEVKVEIKTKADTSQVGSSKAVLKLIFSDTSSKEVEVPVKVIDKIPGNIITPIPRIKAEDIIKEEVPYNGEINLSDNIKNLQEGTKVEDISETIYTKVKGTYVGKVKVTFKDGSSRIVEIQVEVLPALSESFTPKVEEIELNKNEELNIDKLKEGITNLPENIKVEIKIKADTSQLGRSKAVLKLIFSDTSSKEVEVPIKVIEREDGKLITPIPTIGSEDIIKEKVPYNGKIDISDNIKNLPSEAKVEDISETIDTKKTGTYIGKVKVTFKNGSSRIVEIPVEVLAPLSDSFTPKVEEIELNKNEELNIDKLKKGIKNLPEDVKVEIKTKADTSQSGSRKAVLKLIFSDTSSKEVEVPVNVIDKISGSIVTPIPTIGAEDIIKEEVPYNGEINLSDNIKNLPSEARVEEISEKIDTKIPGTYIGKVKVTFKDGASRIVEVPVEVLAPLSDSFTPKVEGIELNKNEESNIDKLRKGITNLPENIKVEIKIKADTSQAGSSKAVLKLIFSDTSSKEVEVPVKVIDKIPGNIITPIPTIKAEDIMKEEVPYFGKINLLDNINNLPDGAKVEDISETIDTKKPGTYTGKVKVTFKSGSSRIVEIPVEVLASLAEKFPVQKPEKTPVEKLESLSASEKSEILEKVKKANSQAATVEVSDRGDVTLIYADGSKNVISSEDTIVLKDKESDKKDPEDKSGKEEDKKDPEDKPGKEKDKKNPEDKPGKEEDKKDPEDKPGKEEYNKNPEENKEEPKNKKENKLDSWNEFPRYYVRNHETPTYKVEVKTNSQVSNTKTKVNPKKFVIDIKSGTYTLTEDGKTLEKSMEVKPIIENNRTMLPLRALAEILDAKVIWNDATRTASFTRDGLTALIQIDGSKIVLSNGKTIDLEAKPLNVKGRIYLPLVYVGQVFGLTSGNAGDDKEDDIEWKEESKTVTINIK